MARRLRSRQAKCWITSMPTISCTRRPTTIGFMRSRARAIGDVDAIAPWSRGPRRPGLGRHIETAGHVELHGDYELAPSLSASRDACLARGLGLSERVAC